MTIAYKVDNNRVYVDEAKDFSLKEPIPRNYIISKPPEGAGYHIWDGNKWFTRSEYPTRPQATKNYGTEITKLAMRNRFTFTEKVAIQTASDASPAVRVWLDDLMASSYIDLSQTDTIQGVQHLESEGIIGVGRADEILNTPVTPNEVPQQG